MTKYKIEIIAYNTYLCTKCQPTFDFKLIKSYYSITKLKHIDEKVFDYSNYDFWKCYDELENFIKENNIDKNNIEYPEIFEYIKY